MANAAQLRVTIESALAHRVPSALTPLPRIVRPVMPTGISAVDDELAGGLPIGAITEVTGPECSGRTAFALSFLSQITQGERVCAWIDVSNALHPESAAACGVDLQRLLWVRCGVPVPSDHYEDTVSSFALPQKYLAPKPVIKGLHGGGFGPHPRSEVRGLSQAVTGLLQGKPIEARCADPQRRVLRERESFIPAPLRSPGRRGATDRNGKPWSRLEQALRVADLLLQAGGFSAIVLDMGSVAHAFALRVPTATWFRYRAAAERAQTTFLLLTQQACAKSSAGLVVRLQPGRPLQQERTVLTGLEFGMDVTRQRFNPAMSNVVPMRKPPQRAQTASWQSRLQRAGQ